jgi:hypothetical protein
MLCPRLPPVRRLVTIVSVGLHVPRSQPTSQAAAALQAISLESPTKPIQKLAPVIDDTRRSPSPLSESEKTEEQELDLRKRFVGDVHLPESMSTNCVSYLFLTVPCRSGATPHGI